MFSIVCTLLLSLPAQAFAPKETPGVDLEPNRLWVRHTETQGRLLSQPAWRAFVQTDGQGWQARFDEATGVPRYLWGTGIAMTSPGPGAGKEEQIRANLMPLLRKHARLLGAAGAELQIRSVRYSETYDTWYVEVDALREGLPTWNAGISARIKMGNLIMMRVKTAPEAPVEGQYVLTAEQAIAEAIAQGPARSAVHTEQSAVPMLLERQDERGLSLRKTFLVRSFTSPRIGNPDDPPGRWVSFVDAETGELLNVHNEVRYIAGTVSGQHHERHPGSAIITSRMPFAIVDGQFDSDVADAQGNFNVLQGNSYSTDLKGDYVEVYNVTAPDGFLSSSNTTLLWTTNQAERSEIDTYKFVHDVKAWGEDVEPAITSVSYYPTLQAYVDWNDVCNAYYDGVSINFFLAGQGCNNTGEIADVVYHEWGHGFHAASLLAGTFDGSLSEGAGDTVSFLQTEDNLMAPYFLQNGAAIRDLAPNRVYPDDFVNNDYYVHDNGLIFGGAMWDLFNLLQDDLGAAAGKDVTGAIFAGLLKAGPEIPDSYFEALVADDNDGNLNNGTPHQCQIDDAFSRHGLADGVAPGGLITSHTPLSIEPAGVPIEVDVELLSAGCTGAGPDGGTVYYRINGGNWLSVNASVSGQHLIGNIPAQPLGTFVEYWVEGSAGGSTFTAPITGLIAPFSFFVGGVLEISCDDFEANDGGFGHELVAGTVQDGADDWQWGAPGGISGDPSDAFSGNNVWGNDLGVGNYNGQYQAEKVNRLFSPPIDTKWYTDVFLHYQRWLNVEDSTYDQGIITVGAPGGNGTEVWRNYAGSGYDTHIESQWVAHAVDLQGLADQTAVEISFELHSDQYVEFGGWTIDDVCVYAPATPNNRLGIVDFEVEDQGGPIGLSWTNPIHGPVDRVVVVRRVDDWPTSWQDGDIVADIANPTVGGAEQAVHGNGDGSSGYYAVYASDGTDWLSWTVEGWNAGYAAPNSGGTSGDDDDDVPGDDDDDTSGDDDDTSGDDDDDTTGDDDDEVPELDDKTPPMVGGCACDNTSSPAPALGGLALLGLLAMRRRR